jgi:phosphatidylglycerophosphate synthase
MSVPNVITIARVAVALVTLSLLFSASESKLWLAFFLTIIVIWADGLDGYFARALKQTSKLGAVLDIAGDRVVEMSYWIVFAVLGWIPVWIPLLFLVRGIFVDAMRSQASEQGFTAFGDKTMMQTRLGKFLVASNFSRFTYAVAKAVAFSLLIAARIKALAPYNLLIWGDCFLYISTAFCIIRGLPVLFEARPLFFEKAARKS